MRYQYHDLHDHEFEAVVQEICAELLGPGVQGFSLGRDGGRDARFEGTATCFPSSANPLTGRVIVQAKHTTHPCAKCGDPDFSGPTLSSILSKEIPKIQKLVAVAELDHYMLFTNRRVSGDVEASVRNRIINQTGCKTAWLIGVEGVEAYLKRHRAIAERLKLPELEAPMRLDPSTLAEVTLAFVKTQKPSGAASSGRKPILRTSFEIKNAANRLSSDFAEYIINNHLADFDDVYDFLSHPSNAAIQEMYIATAEEFSASIIAHQGEFSTFDRVLEAARRTLIERDPDLARNRRETAVLVYYMYWICDIGKDKP